jgi:catechol 2,3-dioxygenase
MYPIAPAEVTLTVADLERSIDYYGSAIGLGLNARENGSARMGVPGRDLVVLEAQPGARPGRGATTGLFHLALLLPSRADLAAWLARSASAGVRLTGASDHFVSEALYLRDPDGHGIEIYADRPRETWTHLDDGSLNIGTVPLDLHDLLAARTAEFERMPDGTVMGHVHLQVAHLEEARRFYTDLLGLDLMIEIPGQASFLSSGGYHHHLGMNIWAGGGRAARAAGPGPARARELRRGRRRRSRRDRDPPRGRGRRAGARGRPGARLRPVQEPAGTASRGVGPLPAALKSRF